eukprot:1378197-Amorphochlora_amoeboformis.AAC.1
MSNCESLDINDVSATFEDGFESLGNHDNNILIRVIPELSKPATNILESDTLGYIIYQQGPNGSAIVPKGV